MGLVFSKLVDRINHNQTCGGVVAKSVALSRENHVK